MAPTPFSLEIPQAQLDDLHLRLTQARWPDYISEYGWKQGTPPDYLEKLVAYWQSDYDWRTHEAKLNAFSQFKVNLEGIDLHFIHQRSTHPHARPLLLSHGWPGSVWEFNKIIPLLVQPELHGGDPAQAFHVVAPSLPGYGFSSAPTEPGWTPRRIGRLFSELMEGVLGYEKYFVQGGDWGSVICSWMANDAPAVAGLHLNMVGFRPDLGPGAPPLSEEEKVFLGKARKEMHDNWGYQAIQGTRPQSMGYGLNDSPLGLAAWIAEKFQAWSDRGGTEEPGVEMDDLLTNIMIYWLTGTITSSMRLYYEFRYHKEALVPGTRVECPTGMAVFPEEMVNPPRSWVERAYNLVHWQEQAAGGHFAALEQPQALSQDIQRFFSGIALK